MSAYLAIEQVKNMKVSAVEALQFHIADAAVLIGDDPTALLNIASVLAWRLDTANQSLIELKRQVQTGQMEAPLGPPTANLVYAGYPCDPCA